jgi:hypothetical protein
MEAFPLVVSLRKYIRVSVRITNRKLTVIALLTYVPRTSSQRTLLDCSSCYYLRLYLSRFKQAGLIASHILTYS